MHGAVENAVQSALQSAVQGAGCGAGWRVQSAVQGAVKGVQCNMQSRVQCTLTFGTSVSHTLGMAGALPAATDTAWKGDVQGEECPAISVARQGDDGGDREGNDDDGDDVNGDDSDDDGRVRVQCREWCSVEELGALSWCATFPHGVDLKILCVVLAMFSFNRDVSRHPNGQACVRHTYG